MPIAERRARRAAELDEAAKDKFDEKPLEWFAGVRDAYLTRVAEQPDRFITIDASQTIENVAGQVRAALESFVSSYHARPEDWAHWSPSPEILATYTSRPGRGPKP